MNRMIEAGIEGVEFIAVNTDQQQMQMSEAPVKINIGRERTQGLRDVGIHRHVSLLALAHRRYRRNVISTMTPLPL